MGFCKFTPLKVLLEKLSAVGWGLIAPISFKLVKNDKALSEEEKRKALREKQKADNKAKYRLRLTQILKKKR